MCKKSESQLERKWRGKCFHTPWLRAVFLQVSELAFGRPASVVVSLKLFWFWGGRSSAEASQPSHIYLVCALHHPTLTIDLSMSELGSHFNFALSSGNEILIYFVRAVCSTLCASLRGVCSVGQEYVCVKWR